MPFILVEVTGLEPAASCSQSKRATNCATPRNIKLDKRKKSKTLSRASLPRRIVVAYRLRKSRLCRLLALEGIAAIKRLSTVLSCSQLRHTSNFQNLYYYTRKNAKSQSLRELLYLHFLRIIVSVENEVKYD